MKSNYIYHRPGWMSKETYGKFREDYLDKDSGMFVCEHCKKMMGLEDHTYDHITPRADIEASNDPALRLYGDSLQNLQPLCVSCNSRKNKFPDKKWGRDFFFDLPLDLSKLRTSQRDYIYDYILNGSDDIFERPAHLLSGVMLTFVQVTGSGKTLGMLTAAFAYNRARRNLLGDNCRRCAKLLVITKEAPLRDQMAHELAVEPLKLGLVAKSPKVLNVNNGNLLVAEDQIDDCDIAVMCSAMLWDRKDFQTQQLHKFQKHFDIQILSEMHYANEQAGRLTKSFTHGITFADTGTPIDDKGRACGRDRTAVGTVFGMEEATTKDDSMKGLGHYSVESPPEVCLRDARGNKGDKALTHQARQVLSSLYGDIITLVDAAPDRITGDSDNVLNNLPAAKSICDTLIDDMLFLDKRIGMEGAERSQHRREKKGITYKVIDGFYSHAIVRCGSVSDAKSICSYINSKLDDRRHVYKKEDGWSASVVTSESENKLAEDHPWNRYQNSYAMKTIDSHCSRILVVVGMACEGINNKPCLFEALTSKKDSMRAMIQGIGRCLRSTHKDTQVDGQVTRAVPPTEFDNIKIIAHARDYGGTEAWKIPWCLYYNQNVSKFVEQEFKTIKDWFETDSLWGVERKDTFGQVDFFKKVCIANAVGKLALDKAGSNFTLKNAYKVAKKYGFSSDKLWKEFCELNHSHGGSVQDWRDSYDIPSGVTADGAFICLCVSAANGDNSSKSLLKKSIYYRRSLARQGFAESEAVSYEGHSDEQIESSIVAILGAEFLAHLDEFQDPAYSRRKCYEGFKGTMAASTYKEAPSMPDTFEEKKKELLSNLPKFNGAKDTLHDLLQQAFDLMLGHPGSVEGDHSVIVRHEMSASPRIRMKMFGFVVAMLADDGHGGSSLEGLGYITDN